MEYVYKDVVIINAANELFKCTFEQATTTNVNEALDNYIEKRLGPDNRFKIDNTAWKIISEKIKDTACLVQLLNSFCVNAEDCIIEIITGYSTSYGNY